MFTNKNHICFVRLRFMAVGIQASHGHNSRSSSSSGGGARPCRDSELRTQATGANDAIGQHISTSVGT